MAGRPEPDEPHPGRGGQGQRGLRRHRGPAGQPQGRAVGSVHQGRFQDRRRRGPGRGRDADQLFQTGRRGAADHPGQHGGEAGRGDHGRQQAAHRHPGPERQDPHPVHLWRQGPGAAGRPEPGPGQTVRIHEHRRDLLHGAHRPVHRDREADRHHRRQQGRRRPAHQAGGRHLRRPDQPRAEGAGAESQLRSGGHQRGQGRDKESGGRGQPHLELGRIGMDSKPGRPAAAGHRRREPDERELSVERADQIPRPEGAGGGNSRGQEAVYGRDDR